MELQVTKKLNASTTFSIKLTDERDLKEALLKLTPFIQIDKCGLCKSEEIIIQARKTKDTKGGEFIYAELVCKKCRAKRNFGEYLQPKGTLFLKGEWTIYNREKPIDEPTPEDEPAL